MAFSHHYTHYPVYPPVVTIHHDCCEVTTGISVHTFSPRKVRPCHCAHHHHHIPLIYRSLTTGSGASWSASSSSVLLGLLSLLAAVHHQSLSLPLSSLSLLHNRCHHQHQHQHQHQQQRHDCFCLFVWSPTITAIIAITIINIITIHLLTTISTIYIIISWVGESCQ